MAAASGEPFWRGCRLGDEPVAVLYGFVNGSRFDFYQSGVRRDVTGRLRSPGNLAHLRLMQTLAERGVTAYDFLHGISSYKERLATRENQLVGVQNLATNPPRSDVPFGPARRAGHEARAAVPASCAGLIDEARTHLRPAGP